ncbi:hypothetical protein [Erwinia aphidicola]|uniref:hypothetical protein n=1 Tax=Erwinia aphidicola TaxID=68334 RepID=UPI00301885D8
MTVYFNESLDKLQKRIKYLDNAFDRHLLTPKLSRCIDRYSLQEGLMSSLWQAWCFYCRDILFGSITGAETSTGRMITSTYSIHNDRQLVYIASRFAAGSVSVTNVKLAAAHLELTWGDVVKLNEIIIKFNPTNAIDLCSSLAGAQYLMDLQQFRNANAHITPFTISAVKSARVRYSNTRMRHPSDTMFWIDPKSKDYLWKMWVEEIEIISNLLAE